MMDGVQRQALRMKWVGQIGEGPARDDKGLRIVKGDKDHWAAICIDFVYLLLVDLGIWSEFESELEFSKL